MDNSSPRPVDVVMFGAPHVRACSGCQTGRTMEEMAIALGHRLRQLFRVLVNYRYIDVSRDDLTDFPEIAPQIKQGQLSLPLTLINGKIVMPGMFSPTVITYRIKQELSNRPGMARRSD